MKIAETCSHLNGLEFLLVHKPALWKEIQAVIIADDATKCKTKVSKEKIMKGQLFFSSIDMNAAFDRLLRAKSWEASRVSFMETVLMLRLVALTIILMGFILFTPLPFMNTLPAFAVMLLGAGLLNRDGIFLLFGLVLSFSQLGFICFGLGALLQAQWP